MTVAQARPSILGKGEALPTYKMPRFSTFLAGDLGPSLFYFRDSFYKYTENQKLLIFKFEMFSNVCGGIFLF